MNNMFLFLCFCLHTLGTILSGATASKAQNRSYDPYQGAAKSAKLIKLVQQINDNEAPQKAPSTNGPGVFEQMKLLQKNYDISRKFNLDDEGPRVNVEYISNPEVLAAYKNEPEEEVNEEDSLAEDLQYSYKNEMIRSRMGMHYLSNPEALKEYRRLIKKDKYSSSSIDESEDVDEGDDDDGDGENDEDEDNLSTDIRRRLKVKADKFIRSKEKQIPSEKSGEGDVTTKLQQTFDIVKPFVVGIFNKLKGKNKTPENEPETATASDGEVGDKVKENIERSIMNKLFANHAKETLKPPQGFTKKTSDVIVNEEENTNVEVREGSLRKKEKENTSDSDSKEKIDVKRDLYDKDWSKKKLPASKKSFVEPSLTQDESNMHRYGRERKGDKANIPSKDWKDGGYGWEHDGNWNKKKPKVDSGIPKMINKKVSSWDSKKEAMPKKKTGKDWRQYDEGKKLDDPGSDRDVNDRYKSNYKDKRNENEKWNKKSEDWNKKKENKNVRDENWNEKNENWNDKENNRYKNDENRNKRDDIQDKWNVKKDIWKKKDDNWNIKKDVRQNKEDTWLKKDDDWNDENSRNKKKSIYKKDEEWDTKDKWGKKDNNWNKKRDDWNNKEENWSKPKDDWNKKGDKWSKKDETWDKKRDLDDTWDKKRDIDDGWDKKQDKYDQKEKFDTKNDNWNKKEEDIDKDYQWNDKNKKVDIPDNKVRDRGWDMVGVNKKNKDPQWETYKKYENKNEDAVDYDKPSLIEEARPKPVFKPKIKNSWDSYAPKYVDKPMVPHKSYNSPEHFGPGPSAFGRTSIPIVGSKSVYAD